MEICIYTLACVYMCVRASCSVPGSHDNDLITGITGFQG